jgi:cytochrome c peroxidase
LKAVVRTNPSGSTSAERGAGSFIDPHTLMRIKSLELRAKIIVQGFLSGLHRSPHHGFSVEFSEYRQYSPGDDPRYLDWRLYARSDRYYIKKFEDETNLRCHLLVDNSRSMDFGSLGYTKAEFGIEQLFNNFKQVGTFNPADPFEVLGDGANMGKQALGQAGFNPPSLIGVFAFGPYLHNGTVVDLEDILNNPDHVGTSPFLSNPAARKQLVRFLKSIDDSTPPFP